MKLVDPVYIAGPMTGTPDWNFPKFHQVSNALREAGRTVVNPAENFGGRTDLPWETYLRLAIQQVAMCNSIVMLPGWEESKGARLEYLVADSLGIPITHWTDA